jgi:hypothetical protein
MEDSIRPPKDTIHHEDTWRNYCKEALEEHCGVTLEPKSSKQGKILMSTTETKLESEMESR